VQGSGQAFSNHVVQAAVLFEHGCPIAPREGKHKQFIVAITGLRSRTMDESS
jgi:hypothetical protein